MVVFKKTAVPGRPAQEPTGASISRRFFTYVTSRLIQQSGYKIWLQLTKPWSAKLLNTFPDRDSYGTIWFHVFIKNFDRGRFELTWVPRKLCLSFLRLLVCSFFIGSLFLCLFVFHTCILLTYSLKVFFAKKKKIPFWFASSSPFYRIRPTYNSWMQNVVQKTPLSTKKLWNVLAVKDKHQISLSNIKCFQFFQS